MFSINLISNICAFRTVMASENSLGKFVIKFIYNATEQQRWNVYATGCTPEREN